MYCFLLLEKKNEKPNVYYFISNFGILKYKAMKRIVNIEGMTCGHCVKAVEGIILDIEGVETVEVSLEMANAVVEFENAKIEDIIDEINDTNYVASLNIE